MEFKVGDKVICKPVGEGVSCIEVSVDAGHIYYFERFLSVPLRGKVVSVWPNYIVDFGGMNIILPQFGVEVILAEDEATTTSCPYAEAVSGRILKRSEAGLKKYGTTIARKDLSPLEWLTHAQEEAMDLAVYLERLREDVAGLMGRVNDRS